MANQVNRDDLETAILDVVRRMNIENAIHSAPVYSLKEILEFKNVTTLRKIGKELHVKYYSKLSKQDLIPAIAENLMRTDNLRNCLNTLDEQEWNFFQEAASQVNYQADVVFDDWYIKAQSMMLLHCFYHDDELYYVVPDEIKAGYMELASNGLFEDQNLRILINNYAIAAVNLYGVISQDELADIFNSQNRRQITVDDVFEALLPYVCTDADYCFWKKYIVDFDFADDDYKAVPLLIAARKGKPRYTPPKEEFLKYSDWDYYETTPQLLTLKATLSEYISDPELVLDVLEEIHDMCSAEVRIQEFFDLLNSVGVSFAGMGQVEVLVQQIMDVQNNTRLWSNFGHTPSELFSTDKSNLIPFPARPASVAKIGRNDPCPCGSGKKYKQCCGR